MNKNKNLLQNKENGQRNNNKLDDDDERKLCRNKELKLISHCWIWIKSFIVM